MPDIDIMELLVTLNNVVYNLKGVCNLETLDTSIVDLKRICKVPYSVVGDGSVCLPLSDEQIANFKPEMISMKSVLKKVMIKNRGLLLRTHNLCEEGLRSNVLKFISEFGV